MVLGLFDEDTTRHGDWPIHAKDVTNIDFDAVAQLSGVEGSTTAATWEAKRGWLEDDGRYAEHGVPIRTSIGTPTANYRAHWIERLLETGVIEQIRGKHVRGHTRIYGRPEPAKERVRALMHTVDINDACGADTIDHPRFPTKLTIAEAVHDGEWMVALDFSAFYYQFKLAPEVGSRMCFRWNRRFFRLCKLAMGQRQSVDVANAVMQRVLDFEHESSNVMSIIDNALFIGTREAVINDAWTFVQRCRAINATLNEVDVATATRDDIEKLARQEGDWGGVHIDLRDKTVQLTAKIVAKIRTSWANRARWRWRHYAAHVGLLFWAWGIVDLPMADFFRVLRYNSEVGREATRRDAEVRKELDLPAEAALSNPFWNEPAIVWGSVWPDLERWTQLATANAPRRVLQRQEPDVLFECDASLWGWSCCGVRMATNETFAFSEPWSSNMKRRFGAKLGQSTLAEPYGVLFSLVRTREKFPDATQFAVTSDNSVAVVTHQRGFSSRSYDINECFRLRDELLPRGEVAIDIKHVAGTSNIADDGSRGRAVGKVDGEMLRSRWGLDGAQRP